MTEMSNNLPYSFGQIWSVQYLPSVCYSLSADPPVLLTPAHKRNSY